MNNEELSQLIRVTKKYYLLNMKQNEIAASEKISKPTVSRLINKAKKMGYVKVELRFPPIVAEELEKELKELLSLKHVYVTESISNDKTILLSQIAEGLSMYLNEITQDNDIIGISWGETMQGVSKYLSSIKQKNGVRIVQLNGGVSRENILTSSERILTNFTEAFNAISYGLNVPSIVDNSEIAEAIMKDSKISETLTLGKKANTAIFSVGFVNDQSVLVKAGYFSEKNYQDLRNQGFVGDVCSRYLKADGSHASGELYNRVIGVNLEDIQQIENSIAIIVGEEKAMAAVGAIKGNYVNTLFTDEKTASEIIDLLRKGDIKNAGN